MVCVRAYVQPVGNSFGVQEVGHPFVLAFAKVVFRSAQHNFHIVKMGALCIGNEIGRAMKIHLLVIVPVEMLLDIERTAHTEEIRHLLRMPEGKIQGVIAAKTTPRYPDFIHLAFRADPGYELLVQHTVVEGMVIHPLPRMQVLGIPTVCIYAVNTVQLNFPRLHKVPGRFHELEILVLIVPTHRSRKQDERIAPMAKDQVFDVAAQGRRVCFMVRFVHRLSVFMGLAKSARK